MMSEQGIWKVEMLGPYGWEPMSTAFMQGSVYRTGGTQHYSTGTYERDGDKLRVMATTVVHKGSRTLFGQTGPAHEMRFERDLKGDTVAGVASDEEGRFLLRFRATKLAARTALSTRSGEFAGVSA